MSNTQIFGRASAINPPISVGGRTCSLLLRFRPSPESPDAAAEIVTGYLESVEALGGGRWQVVCRRAYVTSSVTRSIPGYGGYEECWQSLCGGNIAQAPEPLRIYGWLSDSARRGDRRRDRAEARDMLWMGAPGAERSAFIEEATAFAGEPAGGVNYSEATPSPTVSYFLLNFIDLALPAPDRTVNRDAAIDLALTTGFHADAALYLEQAASPGTFTILSRMIFVGPLGADPDLYPEDAALAEGEYWIDPLSKEIRIASRCENIGTHLLAVYYERGFQRGTLTAFNWMTIEGAGDGLDFIDDDDQTAGVAITRRTDGEVTVTLYEGTGGTPYGVGCMAWDIPTVGLRALITWSAGEIDGFYARLVEGGPLVAQSYTPTTFGTFSQGIKIRKTGSVVDFRTAADVAIGSVDLGAAVVTTIFGRVGVHTWEGASCQTMFGVGEEIQRVGVLTAGDVITRHYAEWTGLVYSKDYQLPTSAALVSAVSESQGAYSGSGDPRRRNHYEGLTSQTFRVYSETCPDIVRVEQAAPATVPSGRGRPPRITSGITRFATGDPETGEATAVALDNRANWGDVLIVRPDDGVFPFGAGDPFTIRRGAGVDPREAWSLKYSKRIGDVGDLWLEVPVGDLVARPSEGIFMPFDDWLAIAVPAGKPCWRLDATLISHHGNCGARQVNEIAAAVETLPQLCSIGDYSGAAASASLAGIVGPSELEYSALACQGGTPQAQGMMWGGTRETWETIADRLVWAGHTLPAYGTGFDIGLVAYDETASGALEFTSAANEVYTHCGTGGFTRDKFGTETRLMTIWPWGDVPPGVGLPPLAWGTMIEIIADPEIRLAPIHLPALFQFSGVPFGIPAAIRRAPEGTEIVEAYVDAKFTGLEAYEWSYTLSGRFSRRPGGIIRAWAEIHLTVNGVEVYRFRGTEVTGGAEDYYTAAMVPATTSTITLDLLGRRRSSRAHVAQYEIDSWQYAWAMAHETPTPEEIAALIAACTYTVEEGRWSSYGTGPRIGSVATSGRWQPIECAAAVRGALAARRSPDSDFLLYPQTAGVDLNATYGSLKGYLNGLSPSTSLEYSVIDANTFAFSAAASGAYHTADLIELGTLMMRLKFPDGTLDWFRCPPIRRGPMI